MTSIYINGVNIIDTKTYLNSFVPTGFNLLNDLEIKNKIESYNNKNDINYLFQYYDFCILINKALNLKDDNKRICDIITPWHTSSGVYSKIDFETMISIYYKCIIQKDYNIKFTSIFEHTFNILNKRILNCKQNKPNFLCEKNQYTYRVLQNIPYKYKGIR